MILKIQDQREVCTSVLEESKVMKVRRLERSEMCDLPYTVIDNHIPATAAR